MAALGGIGVIGGRREESPAYALVTCALVLSSSAESVDSIPSWETLGTAPVFRSGKRDSPGFPAFIGVGRWRRGRSIASLAVSLRLQDRSGRPDGNLRNLRNLRIRFPVCVGQHKRKPQAQATDTA